MSYFAIAAPQTVILPNGTTLDFRVNPADSSQVEIHLTGERDGAKGTWMIPMKRNGTAAGIPEFAALPVSTGDAPPNQARIEAMDDSHPLKAELKRRQDAANDGVALDADGQPPADPKAPDPRVPRRDGDTARGLPDGEYSATGSTKVDPVHGKINTVGMDDHAAKPKEGTNADTPLQDRKDHASVGLKPAP